MPDLDPETQKQMDEFKERLGLDEEGNPPELREELRPYLGESFSGGMMMIQHPLIHTLYTPIQNGMFNKMYDDKLQALKEYRAERNWFAIIFVLYERPYRFEALREFEDEMTDQEWWEMLGSIWTDSENIWQHRMDWMQTLHSRRPHREYMMDESERKALKRLPKEITVHRGFSRDDAIEGFSWTTSMKVATFFANRYSFEGDVPRVITGRIEKRHVIAHFNGRAEHELVVLPEYVKSRRTRKVQS